MDDSNPKTSAWLDRTAVMLSALCLLHCLALPLLVALPPLVAGLSAESLHAPMLLVVLPVSLVAFGLGFRHHGNRGILAGGALGMLLLVLGGTLAHYYLGLAADRSLTVAGALVLGWAHFRNSVLSRQAGAAAA